VSHAHLTEEALLDYVQGRLGEVEERALEQTAAACAECARALRTEARVELALPEIERALGMRRRRRWELAAVCGMAVAAGLALFIAGRARSPEARGVDVASARIALIESESNAQVRESLIQSAFRSGLAVPDGRVLLVPRYESVPNQSIGVLP
jgi:hypothetical protein